MRQPAGGARVIATGDTAQLGAVESGGTLPAARPRSPRRGAARGPPVRRGLGTGGRDRPARDGEVAAVAIYDGRWSDTAAPTPKPPTSVPRRMWLADHLRGKDVCCSPGPTPKPPNCPAASRPGSPSAASSDRRRRRCRTATTPAWAIWSARASTPRSTRRPRARPIATRCESTAFRGPDAEMRRYSRGLDGTWTESFRVPGLPRGQRRARLRRNVHVAQGRTV